MQIHTKTSLIKMSEFLNQELIALISCKTSCIIKLLKCPIGKLEIDPTNCTVIFVANLVIMREIVLKMVVLSHIKQCHPMHVMSVANVKIARHVEIDGHVKIGGERGWCACVLKRLNFEVAFISYVAHAYSKSHTNYYL